MVVASDGRSVAEHLLEEGGEVLQLDGLPTGHYHLVWFDRNGILQERRSLLLLR